MYQTLTIRKKLYNFFKLLANKLNPVSISPTPVADSLAPTLSAARSNVYEVFAQELVPTPASRPLRI